MKPRESGHPPHTTRPGRPFAVLTAPDPDPSVPTMPPNIETLVHSDGYEANVRWWRPARPRGAVLYFHGIQSHGGWYESSGSRLAELGLTVLMPDRRGSGLNRVGRGHSPSLARTLDDAGEALDALLAATGEPSAHLVGVSWGGKLCVALACRCPARIKTLTFIAPGLFPRIDLTPMEKFRVAMSLVGDGERLHDIPLNDARLMCGNPPRIRYIEQDALKLTQVSASFLIVSRRLDRYTARLPESAYRGPVHLMLAGQERIIDNERTTAWFRALPNEDRQITRYPQAIHTIEFEADPAAFLNDLSGWINARTA